MSMANDIFLSVALAADYSSVGRGVSSWKHDGGLNIFVPCLWGNLFFESRECLVCLFVIQVWLWVQHVNETNILKLSLCKPSVPLVLSCMQNLFIWSCLTGFASSSGVSGL